MDTRKLLNLNSKHLKIYLLMAGMELDEINFFQSKFDRKYRYAPQGYFKPVSVTNFLICSCFFAAKFMKRQPALIGSATTIVSLVENSHSWYWLNKDLAMDLNLTKFPLVIPQTLNLPKCGVIILPNQFICEDNETIFFLMYNIISPQERLIKVLGKGEITLNLPPDTWGISWAAYLPNTDCYGGILGLRPNDYQEFELFMDDPEYLVQLNKQESVESQLLALLLNCLVYSKPQNTDTKEIITTKGFGKSKSSNLLYTPLWIGKNYQSYIKKTPTGTHASPRIHVRRGHWRSVPYGEGRKRRKQVWIKPTIVGTKD